MQWGPSSGNDDLFFRFLDTSDTEITTNHYSYGGQIIAEIESDKTTVELPALENGKLIKTLYQEGEEIEVGNDIAIFETI